MPLIHICHSFIYVTHSYMSLIHTRDTFTDYMCIMTHHLWYSALWRVAACCSVLQCVAACCSVLLRVAACCSVLQRVAVYCSVNVIRVNKRLYTNAHSPQKSRTYSQESHIYPQKEPCMSAKRTLIPTPANDQCYSQNPRDQASCGNILH